MGFPVDLTQIMAEEKGLSGIYIHIHVSKKMHIVFINVKMSHIYRLKYLYLTQIMAEEKGLSGICIYIHVCMRDTYLIHI